MPAHLPGGDRGLRAAVFVVVVELLAIPLYLFVEKPLAKYMKNTSGKTCVLWTRCDAISDKK